LALSMLVVVVVVMVVVLVVVMVEVVSVVVVVFMMGMTRRVSRVVVEVKSVVGLGSTGVKTRGGRRAVRELAVGVSVGSPDSDSDGDGGGPAGGVTYGSIVRVRVAVPVERVMSAVRVMGSLRVSEGDSEGNSEGDPEGVSEVVSELVVVELTLELTVELTSEEDGDSKGEVEERIDDSEVGVGSTVTVTVPIPLVTVTMAVLVLRPVGLPVGLPVEDSSVDEPGSIASGMAPRTCLATETPTQPRMTPSVVFTGMAKQALLASRQRRIFQPSPSVHLASPPPMHAAWPGLHADCSVRVAKISLNSRATWMLFWYTSGDTVAVLAGGSSITVGTLERGVPVMVGLTEERLEGAPVESGKVAVAVEFEKRPEVEEARAGPVPSTGAERVIELSSVEDETEELSVVDKLGLFLSVVDRLGLSVEVGERDDGASEIESMGVTTGRAVGDATRGNVMAL
ncbi:hypothetical protein F5144DRAFT_495388, partial [Chaetomium tenue]